MCASGSSLLKQSGSSSQEVRDRYQQSFEQCLLQHHLNTESSVKDQWKIKECILTSAEVAVGYAKKKQPNWFTDATDILRPLLDDKARARQRYLQLQNSSAKHEFRFRQWLRELWMRLRKLGLARCRAAPIPDFTNTSSTKYCC